MAKHLTSWEIASAAGEPHSVIRVQNLQTSIKIGTDAWGRKNKLQPVLISAIASLREPFATASREDAVNKSTIHYGILSKAILEAASHLDGSDSLLSFANLLCSSLIEEQVQENLSKSPVVDIKAVRSLTVQIMLPKASLIGTGVSSTETRLFGRGGIEAISSSIKLHDLRIPTLIGVNPNERLAKQIVVANVELDRIYMAPELYCQFEQIVVKTIEESSFQTLEALAVHVGCRVVKHFIVPTSGPIADGVGYPIVRISLAKPTAVMFADAPAIEFALDSNPRGVDVGSWWQNKNQIGLPPFPLQGRLDEWAKANE